MSSLTNFFQWKSDDPMKGAQLSEIPSEFQGKDAGVLIQKVIEIALGEGWNPIPSIKLHCKSCNAPVSLNQGLLSTTPFVFIHSDGRYGQCQPLEKPLVCKNCTTDLFRVTIQPIQFRDWLRDALVHVKPSDQDPSIGFRDDETGELIFDTLLMRVSSFDELWQAISRHVDPFGDFNPDYSFNMIRTHYLDRDVPGLAHFNKKTNVLTIIIKDEKGNYWYSVEH
jgi:hypothetical protein